MNTRLGSIAAIILFVHNIVIINAAEFVGCFQKNAYLKRLDIFSGSPNVCIDGCKNVYYRYAVLDGNTCLCTSTLNEKEVELDECNRPCTEDASEFCGGGYVQSVYDTEIRVPGPPQNANIINHKDTSILIEWSAPEQKATLTRYVIRAKVVKNYGTMLQAAPPEWTVETTDHTVQYELLNLHPGSKYNISIMSFSNDHGEGGSIWILGETDIGVPDPPPPPAKILNANGKTITIEVPSFVNNNGPITAIHVVVIFVDSELFQQFDENLLKDYKHATEDGLNYYITAALDNENAPRKFVIGNGLNYGGYDNVPLPTDRHIHVAFGIVSKLGNITKSLYTRDVIHERTAPVAIDIGRDDGRDGVELLLLIGCGFLGILLIFSVVGYTYLRIKMGSRLQRLPSDHHELTVQGPMMEVENNDAYQPDGFSKKSFEQNVSDILDQAEPSKNHPRNNVKLDVNKLIAIGQYGDIIGGKLNATPCHVHVVSDDMDSLCQNHFLRELSGLIKLNFHKNLVEFYGYCQSANWLYLLFEETHTSLKTVLVGSRTAPDSHDLSSLSELFILQTLCELSAAMEFISNQKVIHGKLCTHNIFMTNANIPKIALFGMCFDSNGKRIDTSRFSAPEVLRFQHLCIQSDVWSFGCLIWECCSLGGTLFPSINSNELVSRIKEGARPERIPYIHNDMHQLLLNCWQIEPSERPTFSEITSVLWQFLSSPQHILSFKRPEGYTLPYYLPLLEEQNA